MSYSNDAVDPRTLDAAFQRPIEPVHIPLYYRLGVSACAIAMLLLPLVYAGLIVLTAWLWWLHATQGTFLLEQGSFWFKVLSYGGPLVIGPVLIVFLIKPFFARAGRRAESHTLTPESQPVLFAFVYRLCALVGAPRPSRIDVNVDVNASAGLRNPFSSHLTLTLGLPLVAGLDARQFTAIVAHELGHFAQAAGMRFSYIIRSINFWFARVVFERDEWDVRLIQWSRELDLRIGVVFYVARFFVWLSRKILHGLMLTGHALSGFLSRQMEFDADQYAVRVAGVEAFAGMMHTLPLIDFASDQAHSDLARTWSQGRLSDNFPVLVHARLVELPHDVRQQVVEQSLESTPSMYASHPPTGQRIERAAAVNWPAAFVLDAPATALFHDFAGVSRITSHAFYEAALGESVPQEKLIESSAVLAENERLRGINEARLRCFGELFAGLLLLHLDPPPATPATEAELLAAIANSRAVLPAALELQQRVDDANGRLHGAFIAENLIGAGVAVNAREYGLTTADSQAAQSLRYASERERQAASQELQQAAAWIPHRLRLALSLCPNDTSALRDCLNAISSAAAAIDDLRREDAATRSMLSVWNRYDGNELYMSAVESQFLAMARIACGLAERWRAVPYPFAHAEPDITLERFVFPTARGFSEPGDLLENLPETLQRISTLYVRLLAELCSVAEAAEAAALPQAATAPVAPPIH